MEDPIRVGLAAGWKHVDASALAHSQTIDVDVVIVGTGAGGGVTADLLSATGLRVVLVEEGPLRSSSDFKMLESDAYPELYQESAARKTADKAINILQGRCVGGSTTVNWTSSFRTPPEVFAFWQQPLRSAGAERRVDELVVRGHGAQAVGASLGYAAERQQQGPRGRRREARHRLSAAIKRNVKGCWNLGYCGMGCPTNAKQSMLLTAIPAALSRGATLYTRSARRAPALRRQPGLGARLQRAAA
jgi:choline dehydrogenase-like flavoprotein